MVISSVEETTPSRYILFLANTKPGRYFWNSCQIKVQSFSFCIIFKHVFVVLIPKYGLEGTLYLDSGDIKSVYDEEVSAQT